MLKPLVIYHANCQDGFGAAFAAWKKFGDEAEYFPMQYGDWPKLFEDYPNGGSKFDGRDVYVLDFSFTEIQTRILLSQSKRLVWRDHHKTAFESWCGNDYLTPTCQTYEEHEKRKGQGNASYILLDNTKAGCILAWEYFHPDKPIPMMLQHIGDRDIWKFELPNTKAFCEAFSTWDRDFNLWNAVATDEFIVSELIQSGTTLINAMGSRVASFSDSKKLKRVRLRAIDTTDVDGWRTCEGLATNCMSDISETGNAIAKISGTYSLTFFVTDIEVVCSLRSIGDYDVSVIAKFYGGGGHKNASGFKMPIERFFKEVWA